eukprot:TRINITY_DN25781_c0_g1_i2.p1 TRINITY_DN25781_c0_g1~~TRINITY_DN25781_c0_g1_i2.p1  ORF type:complete len:176 (+),score=41.84 TRINITY_DN25781_c0_g1_i2:100-627(+)
MFFFFNDTATTEIYTRSIVGSVRCVQETGINAEYMGFIDTTGSLVHGQGAVFNWMIEGVFDRERVVAISAEPEKNHMATTKVFVDTKPLIKRAVDIILGHSKPFSVCETHDNIYIQEQAGQISRKYSVKEYFYMTRHKTVGQSFFEYFNSNIYGESYEINCRHCYFIDEPDCLCR